ncbi:hypothetical protein LPJ73_000670 [Coemansia sp. RSA 2703]|nr:hypothetical protein LPJ73_000670 [Coemansia sp. RSA 2703]KAJ2397917.1 hypothetical protein GGI05_000392 [Coemansia sp. RSA 2603]
MESTLWLLTLVPLAALVHLGKQSGRQSPLIKRALGQKLGDGLCALALRLIHLIFAIHWSFQEWVQRSLTQADLDVQELLLGEDTVELADKRQQLADFLQALPQRPENFAVILPETSECAGVDLTLSCDVDSVETLCAWGLLAKLPRMTIYTRDGRLKNTIEDIEHRLKQSKMVQRAFGGSMPNIVLENGSRVIKRERNFTADADTSPDSNRRDSKPDMHVSLWSRDDGFPALVELSKELAGRAKSGMLSFKSVDESFAATMLEDPAGHAHPDLMLLYDDLICVPEFPPWQLQNTEVFQIGSAAKSLGDAVVRALTSYAKIEKRWGK